MGILGFCIVRSFVHVVDIGIGSAALIVLHSIDPVEINIIWRYVLLEIWRILRRHIDILRHEAES